MPKRVPARMVILVTSHHLHRRIAALIALAILSSPASAAAYTVHYALGPESQVVRTCQGCEEPMGTPEPLQGTFDITLLQVPSDHTVEAVTGIDWRSESFNFRGTGFIQRLGGDHVAMVLDTKVNGSSVLLTSGRRRPSLTSDIRIHLSSPHDAEVGYVLTIIAVPEAADGPDSDGDGVSDTLDNCPTTDLPDQEDTDNDGAGDVCDLCPETPLGSPVLSDGCAPSQRCPCEGPDLDTDWQSQRQYVQCVAQTLKQLHEQRRLSRSEIRQMMKDAVRSGCGRRILALR